MSKHDVNINHVITNNDTYTGGRRRPLHILGAGGVGSNLFSTFLENLENFSCKIYDYDMLEPHNLNRSYVFSILGIGRPKVKVLEAVHRANTLAIETRTMKASKAGQVTDTWKEEAPFPTGLMMRMDTTAYREKGCEIGTLSTEWTPGKVKPSMTGRNTRVTRQNFDPAQIMGVIIDARDSTDPAIVIDRTYIKLAYNGGSELSFHFGPAFHRGAIWDIGGDNSYEVVPSFFVPAALLSEFTYFFLQYISPRKITQTRACVHKVDIDDEIDKCAYDVSGLYEDDE